MLKSENTFFDSDINIMTYKYMKTKIWFII